MKPSRKAKYPEATAETLTISSRLARVERMLVLMSELLVLDEIDPSPEIRMEVLNLKQALESGSVNKNIAG